MSRTFHAQCVKSLPCSLHPLRPLLFVSDLHLGDGSAADDFAEGAHRAAFEWFLEHEVEADEGELILLGDIFELWQCGLDHIRNHYPRLFWRLHNYRLLRGNHDAAYRKPPEWRWPKGRPPLLLAEHGHLADPLNSSLGFVGWGATVVAGLLERLGWRDVDKSQWRWKAMPTPVTAPSRFPPGHYERYAQKRAREHGAEVVVLAHTHNPKLEVLDDGLIYANDGCWVSKDYAGSWVRVHDGRVELCRVGFCQSAPGGEPASR